jgi:hypothetical protein
LYQKRQLLRRFVILLTKRLTGNIFPESIFFPTDAALIYATPHSMTTNTVHFNLEEWADFGRGRVQPDDRARMEQHLDQGCSDCARTLALWNGVLDAASREEAFEPPNHVLRCAKALYAAFPPERSRDLSLRICRLAHIGHQALEGVRTAPGAGATHLLFQEGSLLLDMQVRPKPASESVSMLGQVVDSAQQHARLQNRAVSVVRASKALARTTTNEFGEFELEFEAGEDRLLIIELPNNSYLVARLPAPK